MRRKQESIQARMINGSSDLFSIPDDEFTELAWENGQIVMQNQYSKSRKETREKVGKFPQQDDDDGDIVPWISYPIEEVLPSETLQDDDYCAEFLNEFSTFDVNPLSAHRSKEEVVIRSSNNVEHGHVPKAPTWSRIRTSHHTQQFQASAPNSKSTVVDNNAAQELDRRLQKQQQQQQGSLGTLMNFSHFARPAAALAKAKPHITTISNPSASKDVDKVPGQLELGSSAKTLRGGGEGGSVEFSNKISGEETLRNKKNCSDLPEGLLPSSSLLSSMCSGNINAAASNEPKHGEKRKEYDAEDSDYLSHSEDLQDEYADIRKLPTGRGERAKRGRAAEVHNLSERRRRNRINEKMRALQELIPNCNKVDKASMLEEAIEYLKTLQMQVQIMSMGSRLYMPPPMMFPPAMQHMRGPMVAHFPSVGVGVGAGMGLTPGCPMIPIPPIHAPQFPCTPSSGLSCMNGIPGPIHPSMFGVQGQGFPVLMPRPPQFSTLAGLSLNTNAEPDGHTNNAVGITSDHQSNASTDETQIQVTKDRL